MRKLLTVISVILLIAGLVFAAQGSGYFPHPAESFMINQTRWVYYGAAIAVAGLLLVVWGRRDSEVPLSMRLDRARCV